jgi:hypothetical protein
MNSEHFPLVGFGNEDVLYIVMVVVGCQDLIWMSGGMGRWRARGEGVTDDEDDFESKGRKDFTSFDR